VFVLTVCILNRIPCFLVGKPGSSKTLAVQTITSNLQGAQSTRPLWRRFPAVHLFQYQCSPLSDSDSIQAQHDKAARYQQQASEDTITVLLLDEVGLAELSPNMPLKVLHAILVNPPIAIVGLSNHCLDPAKMNRAICLQRPEPRPADVSLTGRCIFGDAFAAEPSKSSTGLSDSGADWVDLIGRAYHEIYTQQSGREWWGMRDYYSLLKLLRKIIRDLNVDDQGKDYQWLVRAICRNFGGKDSQEVLEAANIFLSHYNQKKVVGRNSGLSSQANPTAPRQKGQCRVICTRQLPSPVRLIADNLMDTSARHVMVLTVNGAALPLMMTAGMLHAPSPVGSRLRKVTTLIDSEFPGDRNTLHLVNQINKVKVRKNANSDIWLPRCTMT
jgi:hypothetical protein